MSAGTTPAVSPQVSTTRRAPRYKLAVPLDLTVLRSGIPDRIPGRTLEIGEGGVGVVVASRLLLGESVRVEFLLPHTTTPVRATAVVRYEHQRSFGLQFLRLPEEQQYIIRYWTRCEGEVLLSQRNSLAMQPSAALPAPAAEPAPAPAPAPALEPVPAFNSKALLELAPLRMLESEILSGRKPVPRRLLVFAGSVVFLAIGLGWWQWQRSWDALEAPAFAAEAMKPDVKLPAETMQQRIRHKVMPDYPDTARQAGVQGTVLLDVIVNPEGAVTQVKVLSGPESLTRPAADAVRWWRYEPYVVNGQPATVETTVVMDFRLNN